MQPTITQYTTDHMTGKLPDLFDLTLRQALAVIRSERDAFGDIGGLHADLSDGTIISVELRPASDGGYLMNSQRIVRGEYLYGAMRINAHYPW